MLKIAILATMTVGFTCLAQQAGGAGRLKSHLSLTDSQIQNLRSMRESNRQSAQASTDELHSKEKALRDQLRAGSTDAATLGRLLIDIEGARKRSNTARQSFREQAVGSLSADQKTRLKSLEEARKLMPAIREAEMMGFLDAPEGDDRPRPPFGRAGGPPTRGGRGGGNGGPRFDQ